VLSEVPVLWARSVRKWSKMNAPLRRGEIPQPNEEMLLYQTLAGMWPLDEREIPSVSERLRQNLEKAAREAKTYSSWIAPNAEYEQALLGFGDAVLKNVEFCEDFVRFQKRIAFYGAINALSQVVLKAMSPGVPDFYQGSELWDFSLVDPDNRRPVNYERREAILRQLKSGVHADTLLRRWFDGRIKLFVTWKTLELRARRADLFRDGPYEAVDGGRNVCAFLRGDVLVATPRFVTELVKPGTMPIGQVWRDATLPMGGRWRDIFSGAEIEGETLPLSKIFAQFPVAVLERT
jgi:(1->4)-alpha-D-glucan 1-alpha-D-glucosylmutase